MKKYNNNIKKVFELLSLDKNYIVVGSSKNNLFFSDYDMNSLLNYKGKNIETKLYKEFLNIFKVVEKNDELFITDFKLGEDEKGEPLRWTFEKMKKNNNNGYTFQEALKQKSTIKMDITIYLNGTFKEISDNYFFTINNYKTFDKLTKEEQIINLQEKYREYVDKKAYFKALRRLRSLINLSGRNKELELLDEFLDNKNGYLYEVWSEISVIYQLLELKKKVNMDDVYNSIEKMKEIFSYFDFKNLFDSNFKTKTKKAFMNVLEKQNKIINEYLNKEVCLFIKKNKL
jgi:hypothetical protein